MCGRYTFIMNDSMVTYLDAMGVDANPESKFNIAPTESVPIIFEQEGRRECHMARWWLTPAWSNGPDTKYSMFNARAENLETSRAFKGPFHHQRCIVPASSFIEWKTEQGNKQPYEIMRQDGQPISIAGLWDCWNEELVSCAMVTTKASKSMQAIHNRMPLMLDNLGANHWLDTSTEPASLAALMSDQLSFSLQAYPVDKTINNGKHKAKTVRVGQVIELPA